MADVVILGCGFTGTATARLARACGLEVLATVRSEARATALLAEGIDVVRSPELDLDALAGRVSGASHVVVAFPPDGVTDARVAPRLAHAAAITYVSSTGVYGDIRGRIDDATPVPEPAGARAAPILAAEALWRASGATVLRCPGIYGPDRGLHMRMRRGEHRIPGDGSTFGSRIHVADLARLILAAKATRGETFVVGDLEPATQKEIVTFIVAEHGVPFPPSVALADVPASLRADRRVDGSRALSVLHVTLAYPSFREGMSRRATLGADAR